MSKKYLETIKSIDGIVQNIEYHQLRLEGLLSHLNIKEKHNLKEILNPPSDDIYRCRVVYDANSINVQYHKYKKRIIKNLKLVYDDYILYENKYESREDIENLFSKKENCDDILIIKNSFITDTSIANVAFFDGKQWLTPRDPLLHGTTRMRLLKEKKIIEKDIKVEDIKNFSKIALMNAMIDFDIIAEDNIEEMIC